MSDAIVTCFFKAADGVHEVRLAEVDARNAANRVPWEWSLSGTFAESPEGFVASIGPAGGLNPLRGASINFDHPAGANR